MRAACRALPRLGRLAPARGAPTGPGAACAGGSPGTATAAATAHGAAFSAAAGRIAATAASASKLRWAAVAAGLGLGAAGAAQLYGSSGGGCPAECQAGPGAGATSAGGGDQLRKTRVVVLGTGWGAISFLKQLDPATYGREYCRRTASSLCAGAIAARGQSHCVPAAHKPSVRAQLPSGQHAGSGVLPLSRFACLCSTAAADGRYDLTVVSPRSFFLYTPLLPSAAAGSVQVGATGEQRVAYCLSWGLHAAGDSGGSPCSAAPPATHTTCFICALEHTIREQGSKAHLNARCLTAPVLPLPRRNTPSWSQLRRTGQL